MKQSFNLFKEYLTESVSSWNKIQADNNTCIKIKVSKDNESFILWDDKGHAAFTPIGFLFQGIVAMGYSYFFQWNRKEERIELVIY